MKCKIKEGTKVEFYDELYLKSSFFVVKPQSDV